LAEYETIDNVKDKNTRAFYEAWAEVLHAGNVQEVIDIHDANADRNEAEYYAAKREALLRANKPNKAE
jgi:hypothetical protein